MDPALADVLKRMGWTTGMHLPVANDENKALQDEVEALMVKKARATHSFETEESRYQAFAKHLKFVTVQNDETQQLLTTYHHHLDNQEHCFLVKQSERERVLQEIRQAKKLCHEINERVKSKKVDLDRGLTKIEKRKLESDWDKEALEAWDESLKKKDEDNEILKKFSREDEKKAKNLEIKRQNLQKEILTRTSTLNKVVADVHNYELIIERIGKVFKQQKEERQGLLTQWRDAVELIKKRDQNMRDIIAEVAAFSEILAQEREKLDEQDTFLKNQTENNKETEEQIAEINFASCKMRQDLNSLIQTVLTLNSEANSLKRLLISTANCLEKQRMTGKKLSKDISDKESQIKQQQRDLEKLKQKLKEVKNSSLSASERASQLEAIIEEEQRETKILDQDVERTQGVLFRTQQVLNELRDNAKTKEMEISGCEMSISLLKKGLIKSNKELQTQREINYDLDFRVNEMESRIDRIEGNTVDEDTQQLRNKIDSLEEELADETEVKTLIQNQIAHIENEMRRLTSAIQADNQQMETLKDKLQNEVLSCEDGTKQSVEARNRMQQQQVNENVFRLRVNQMENIMKREENCIYNIQKLRLELEMAMRQRQIEISTNKEILIAKRRNLDEEKGRLKRDLILRQTKIGQLQQRFHLASMALGKDEDGKPLSVTYFKIKNAQEKRMLQDEGDEMDAKIRKYEKEIVAMENTLRVVNLSNVTYKQSLSAVEELDPEFQEKKMLESEISAVNVKIRVKKQELVQKKNYIKELTQMLSSCDEDKTGTLQMQAVYEGELGDLKRHEEGHVEKLNRADRHLHTCMKNLDMAATEKYHKNIFIRQLQEANKSALQQLAEISTRFQDMTPHITRYTYEYDVQLPGQRLQFSCSSSSCSTRSSEYYLTKPSISSILLEFNATAECGSRSAKKNIKLKPKRKT
ncbi:hypothetical protein PPYR_08868 [Photinus pyralis]|uniref:Coiled-coil domain-containing protein 39 n=1 Tax=Photinus pyralis TaxID=7054 RepID=A0A5N4AKI6_PHOPY|nr:coiled-coil domain-containing protein 39 [Photinus pyralis]KAB0797875.1 hypothetical protein PPYR_08868 [Photinus pyralis]